MKSRWIGMTLILTMTLIEAGCCQEKTETTSRSFLPGIVSTGKNEFGSCFSRDRKSFYFARTIGKKSKLFVTTQTDTGWSEPARIAFCANNYAYADPAFSPTQELYFISDMPATPTDTTADYDIWKTFFENGRWADPVNVKELNSPENEFYISFTKRGDAYFSSSRTGGFGQEDIYRATFFNGKYTDIENAGSKVNTIHSEYDPFINEDETILFFASSGRADSFGKADLYLIEKQTEWEEAIHLGTTINSSEREYCPNLVDKINFYFSSNGDVKVVKLNTSR